MAYGSGTCPQCGVKYNVNKSSVGTVKRCAACGAKFIVPDLPASGCSCLTIIVGVLIGGGLLVVVACAGIAMLGSRLPPPKQAENSKAVTKPAAQPDPPRAMTRGSTVANSPPIDVAALCGLTIDDVRKVLGPPVDNDSEPTALQIEVGIHEWDNNFEKGGRELLVTFDARNRRVIDFFVGGDNISELKRIWALDAKSEKYRLEPVKALRGGGYTGIIIVPTASASKTLATTKPPDPPPTKEPAPQPKATDVRTWTDRKGKFSTEATFGGMSNGTVTLHKNDGKTITIKLDQLSAADRDWIEARRK